MALIFPPQTAYSKEFTDGIMERHLGARDWTVIELPRLSIGRSPLPTGKWHLDGALIWAEPRDLWVHTLLERQVKVLCFGSEWMGVPGVASIRFSSEDLHQKVICHFKELGLRQTLALGHHLDARPGTRYVLEAFARASIAHGMDSKVADIGGKLSPVTSPQRMLKPDSEQVLASLLKALPKPAGVYGVSDAIGFIVCEVAAKLGLRVPEDLAVVGQGGNRVGAFARVPVTTVVGPGREVGLAMADDMARWLTTGAPPAVIREIPGGNLITRESTVGKSGSAALEAVRRSIRHHATTGITLGQLSNASGLGTKTLIRRYRSSFGIDPLEEIHRLRLSEARRLLATPHMTVAETAATCGFSSQAGFYNYFKRHIGIAPSEFQIAEKSGKST